MWLICKNGMLFMLFSVYLFSNLVLYYFLDPFSLRPPLPNFINFRHQKTWGGSISDLDGAVIYFLKALTTVKRMGC